MSKKKESTNLGIFNQERYHGITLNDARRTPAGHMSPATTDGLANHAEAVISFFHVPSESDVFFKAFITTFAESYQSDWNNETVFGRTDPIYTFKNTQRTMTLGWKIPADTIGEAYNNLAKVQKLAQFLYPNYADLGASGAVLSQSPLVRLKVMNLAAQYSNYESDELREAYSVLSGEELFKAYKSTNNPSEGILGIIQNVNINHNLENPEIGVIQPDNKQNLVLPKMIEVTIDFACIHETTLGWTEQNQFMSPSFPYNARAEDEFSALDNPTYDQKIAARQATERKRAQAEQDRINAEARGYNGMFGEKRFNKDLKQLDKIAERNERRAKKGKDPRARDVANAEYFESAIRGHHANNRESYAAAAMDAID